ncbi:MAG: hypothetical protein HWE15_15975 [Algoriphagus sp.]|uniref:hypothetical protein n=1 Tax=Algoriphagus sp. TaxID=1872435 RepID=UPI00180C60C8|nr:hypothetical protein [Algoriphagus sp.]NVJ87802.1 hypothetical protein [Algoriphagus sp.]
MRLGCACLTEHPKGGSFEVSPWRLLLPILGIAVTISPVLKAVRDLESRTSYPPFVSSRTE